MQFDREDEDAPILHPRTSNADQGAQNSAEEEHQKAPYAPPSRRGGERPGVRPQALIVGIKSGWRVHGRPVDAASTTLMRLGKQLRAPSGMV